MHSLFFIDFKLLAVVALIGLSIGYMQCDSNSNTSSYSNRAQSAIVTLVNTKPETYFQYLVTYQYSEYLVDLRSSRALAIAENFYSSMDISLAASKGIRSHDAGSESISLSTSPLM